MILHFTFGGLYMFRFIIGITAFILSFVGYGISLRKKKCHVTLFLLLFSLQ